MSAAAETRPLRDLCEKVEKVDPRERPADNFTYIDISSIDRATKTIEDPKTIEGGQAPSRARQLLKAGDVLVSTVRPNLKTIARVPEVLDGAVASTGFCVLRPGADVSPDYLFWVIQDAALQERLISKARGVSYPAIRDKDVLEESITVPRLAEQRAIVAAIEDAFAQIDAIEGELAAVERGQEQFRTAVLRDAFPGEIPGMAQDDESAPGWERLALGDLGAVVRGVTYKKPQASAAPLGGHVQLLRATNITGDSLSAGESLYVPRELVRDDQVLRHGDILLAASSGSLSAVGKAAVVPPSLFGATFGAFCSVVRLADPRDARYVGWALQGPDYRAYVKTVAAGTNINNLKPKDLAAFSIPFPPPLDRRQIVAAIEEAFTKTNALTDEVTRTRSLLGSLRASVLNRAFAGELLSPRAHGELANDPATEVAA